MGRRWEYAIGECVITPTSNGGTPHDVPLGHASCVPEGNIVWDAAVAMHSFFKSPEYFKAGSFKGKRILELGSGTGLGT
jgi:hypothetical protein